ncbi:MAG: serine/threonine protein kinase, partial [Bacteroidaceae bacterium]|nr:serine/threonine protein kinase [Bacteroidaceae bacterium]
MNDDEPSGIIFGGLEDIDDHFTNLSEVRRTKHNVLVRAMRYGQWWMLKGLIPDEADMPVFQEMLRKEFEIHVRLNHPNISRVTSLENVEGLGTCIVMEWVEGETLSSFLARHPSIEERHKVMGELIEGVKYLHQNDVVHRDLKPQNIMVTRNGHNVKIIDFGLADTDAYAVLKQPGGTERYMSPEQKAGGNPDMRNDIYSIGVILSQMGLGRKMDLVVKHCLMPIERRYQNIMELESDIRHITDSALPVRIELRPVRLIAIMVCLLSVGSLAYYLYPKGRVIDFADPAVEALCVANWDTNHDGELSFNEAAAVTDLGEVFKGNTEITSFDELQYFTGLTDSPLPIHFALSTWKTSAKYDNIVITSDGTTLYQNDFSVESLTDWTSRGGQWQVENGALRQTDTGMEGNLFTLSALTLGNSYTIDLDATKVEGDEGFLICFNVADANNYCWWNIGGRSNTKTHLQERIDGNLTDEGNESSQT